MTYLNIKIYRNRHDDTYYAFTLEDGRMIADSLHGIKKMIRKSFLKANQPER